MPAILKDPVKLARKLDVLAADLKLTPKQRCFAEALEADPEGNQTTAAIAAGYKRRSATVTASDLVRHPGVIAYRAALRKAAIVVSRPPERARDTRAAVASLAEALAHQTTVMRQNAADLVTPTGGVDLDKLRALPAGVLRRFSNKPTEHGDALTYELESPAAASAALIRHYDGVDAPAPDPGLSLSVKLSPQALGELAALFLATPDTGDAQAAHEVADTSADNATIDIPRR